MSHAFEATLPWECLGHVIRLVRGGNLDRDGYLELAQHANWFMGCAATLARDGNLVGAAQQGDTVETVDLSVPDDQLANRLAASVPAEGTAGISWIEILTIVLPILLELLNRNRNLAEA